MKQIDPLAAGISLVCAKIAADRRLLESSSPRDMPSDSALVEMRELDALSRRLAQLATDR
jgi:hypothetical protein